MQVVGFTLNKMSAEKIEEKITFNPSVFIKFTDVTKEKSDLLKDQELIKIAYEHNVSYEDPEKKDQTPQGKVSFEGTILIAATKDEAKEISKSWKKKQLPGALNLNLSNFLLRKCTPKTIFLQDEINLPFHTPMPKLSPHKPEN